MSCNNTFCQFKYMYNNNTDTFILASANGHLDTIKYLVEVHHCDPRRKLNNTCTLL